MEAQPHTAHSLAGAHGDKAAVKIPELRSALASPAFAARVHASVGHSSTYHTRTSFAMSVKSNKPV